MSNCHITKYACAGPDINTIFYDWFLPFFILVKDAHGCVVTNGHIIANGDCSEEHSTVMP
ncbi:MAG: hypothetical protein AMS21_00095 [Gemmatimonas sp. SG8_38_2]|nr:MAG: hypothetical protein AMS21_00095 [Gemmatimonas sp. SG8_38_2]